MATEPRSGTSPTFREALASGRPLVLDGASGTMLEERGVRPHPRIWSSIALVDNVPAVRALHKEYFAAGANIGTTVTYQASLAALGTVVPPSEVPAYLALAVSEARAAKTLSESSSGGSVPQPQFVAGSIGPYGAFLAGWQEYTGEYGDVSLDELKSFHRPTIRAMVAAEPDLLLFETVPSIVEVQAISELLRELGVKLPVILSLSLRTPSSQGASPDGRVTLADHSSMQAVADVLRSGDEAALDAAGHIDVVGANCFPVHDVPAVLAALADFDRPLAVYPNQGRLFGSDEIAATGASDRHELWNVAAWHAAGATIIGGCCETGPPETKLIAGALASLPRRA